MNLFIITMIASLLSGLLGGIIGAHLYQYHQRINDSKRWEKILEEARAKDEVMDIKENDDVLSVELNNDKPHRRKKSQRAE